MRHACLTQDGRKGALGRERAADDPSYGRKGRTLLGTDDTSCGLRGTTVLGTDDPMWKDPESRTEHRSKSQETSLEPDADGLKIGVDIVVIFPIVIFVVTTLLYHI